MILYLCFIVSFYFLFSIYLFLFLHVYSNNTHNLFHLSLFSQYPTKCIVLQLLFSSFFYSIFFNLTIFNFIAHCFFSFAPSPFIKCLINRGLWVQWCNRLCKMSLQTFVDIFGTTSLSFQAHFRHFVWMGEEDLVGTVEY